jgi:hypothetical protein
MLGMFGLLDDLRMFTLAGFGGRYGAKGECGNGEEQNEFFHINGYNLYLQYHR